MFWNVDVREEGVPHTNRANRGRQVEVGRKGTGPGKEVQQVFMPASPPSSPQHPGLCTHSCPDTPLT